MLSYQAEVSEHVSGELTSLIAPQHFASNLDISFSPSKLIVARDGGSFYDTKNKNHKALQQKRLTTYFHCIRTFLLLQIFLTFKMNCGFCFYDML